MKNKIKILILFFTLSIFAMGEFEKLDIVEMKLFGYQVSTDKSLDERVEALERVVSGGRAEGNINSRIDKISDFLLKDGTYVSPATKIGNIERFLYKKRNDKEPILERVENVESFLFKKINNSQPLTSRITRIYTYLFETMEEITLNGDTFKIKSPVKLTPITDILSAKEGDEVFFLLKEDIKGSAKAGSKLRGKIIRKEKSENSEKLKIMIYEMVNEELREINIYKKLEIIIKDKKAESGYQIEDIGIIG